MADTHTPRRLTVRQARFIEEYAVDGVATAAARRAGYVGSSHSVAVTASRLLARPDIKARLAALEGERLLRVKLTADRVLEDLQRLAEKAEKDGDWGAAIRAEELLGKYFRLFTERVEHTLTRIDVVDPYASGQPAATAPRGAEIGMVSSVGS